MTNPFQQGQPQQGGNPFQGGGGQGNPYAPQQPPPQQQQGPPPNQFTGQAPPTAPPQYTPPAAPPPGQDEEFGQPGRGSGDGIVREEWISWIGALVLFEPQEFRTAIPTANGEADAVIANVHVIDVDGGPILKERAMVFPPALVTATRDTAQQGGGKVLGRIGAYKTKAGRDTVELLEHSEQDARIASEYLRWRAQQSMQQPAQAQQPEEPPF